MRSKRDILIEQYIEGVNKIYPQLNFGSVFSMFSGDEPVSGKFEFSGQNSALRNSDYGARRQKSFIHYTNTDALFNILHSKELRLYNLYNLNDTKELNFALNKIGVSKEDIDIEYYKRSLFVASFCSYDSNKKNEDYNMWRLYGNDGSGVAIVFRLLNYQDNWNDLFFGKVLYGENNIGLLKLKSFIEYHKNFNALHNNAVENLPKWVPICSLLNKNEIWKIEKEYRLFCFCPFEEYELKNDIIRNYLTYNKLNHLINRRGKKVSYTSIGLNVSEIEKDFKEKLESSADAKTLLSSFPHFKIDAVITGYNFSDNMYFDLSDYLGIVSQQKLGYYVPTYASQYS